MTVEATLEFDSPDELETELRGLIELIALAEDGSLESGEYAEIMADVGQQAVCAHEQQVLGWFLNGERIGPVSQ